MAAKDDVQRPPEWSAVDDAVLQEDVSRGHGRGAREAWKGRVRSREADEQSTPHHTRLTMNHVELDGDVCVGLDQQAVRLRLAVAFDGELYVSPTARSRR